MSDKKGFTLVEIITVLVIIGILVTMCLPVYTTMIEQSKAQAAMNNVLTIGLAGQNYYFTNDDWCRLGNGCGLTLASINAGLNLNILDNSYAYECTYFGVLPNRFYCVAIRYYGSSGCTAPSPNNYTCNPPFPPFAIYPQIIYDPAAAHKVTCYDGGTGWCPQPNYI